MSTELSPLTVVVCDDDALTRTAVAAAVEAAGATVLAESDSAQATIALIDGFDPDVVVIDLAITIGTGREIIDHVLARNRTGAVPVQAIVFSAFADSVAHLAGPGLTVLDKTSFAELEAAIVSSRHATGAERRRQVRDVAAPTMRDGDGLDDQSQFYDAVASAQPGDVLMAVTADPAALRSAVRSQDRVMVRRERVLAVLVAAGATGLEAVTARLHDAAPDAVVEAIVIGDETDPFAAFHTLTS